MHRKGRKCRAWLNVMPFVQYLAPNRLIEHPPPSAGVHALSAYPRPATFQCSTISLRYTATTRCSARVHPALRAHAFLFLTGRRTLGVHRGPRRLGTLEKAICDPKIDAPWRVGGRWDANGRESHLNRMIGRALGSGGGGQVSVSVWPCALCGVGMSVCCINRILNAWLPLRGGRLSKVNHNAILCHRSREKGSVFEEELGTIRDVSFFIICGYDQE